MFHMKQYLIKVLLGFKPDFIISKNSHNLAAQKISFNILFGYIQYQAAKKKEALSNHS